MHCTLANEEVVVCPGFQGGRIGGCDGGKYIC